MNKQYHKIIIALLAAIIGMGSIADLSIGYNNCPPKSCCCTPSDPHTTPSSVESMGAASHSCPPKAPCCKLQPLNPSPDAAIISSSEIFENRSPVGIIPVGLKSNSAQTLPSQSLFLKNGIPKAPSVPLYLQTMTFLC